MIGGTIVSKYLSEKVAKRTEKKKERNGKKEKKHKKAKRQKDERKGRRRRGVVFRQMRRDATNV